MRKHYIVKFFKSDWDDCQGESSVAAARPLRGVVALLLLIATPLIARRRSG